MLGLRCAINLGCVIVDRFGYHVIVTLGFRCAITLGSVILLGFRCAINRNPTVLRSDPAFDGLTLLESFIHIEHAAEEHVLHIACAPQAGFFSDSP